MSNINDSNDRPDPISGYPAIVGDGVSGIEARDRKRGYVTGPVDPQHCEDCRAWVEKHQPEPGKSAQ